MNENVRDMDTELKNTINSFFYEHFGVKYVADDLTNELEEHLKEKGFDLGCVVQYKNK